MTPNEAAKRFEQLEKMIQRNLPTFIQERVAHDAAWMIENRVRTTGRTYQGRPFKPYSRKPMLTSGTTANSSKIARQLAGSKSKRKQLQWRTVKHKGKNVRLFILPGGYAQMRQLEGLQSTFKDFWFTTQMWRGFGTKRVSKQRNQVTVTLGGTNAESQMKIDENSKREGVNIINISDSELKDLAKIIDKELQKYIDKLGLS